MYLHDEQASRMSCLCYDIVIFSAVTNFGKNHLRVRMHRGNKLAADRSNLNTIYSYAVCYRHIFDIILNISKIVLKLGFFFYQIMSFYLTADFVMCTSMLLLHKFPITAFKGCN